VGDFEVDTRVERDGEQFVARLSRDWEVWGPNGGYVASIALRAAGAASRFRRPASFSAHYLSVAEFDRVELDVRVLRAAKRAESLRVSMTQRGKPVMEALVWTVETQDALEHDEAPRPVVPPPAELKTHTELTSPEGPHFKFWDNFVCKPIGWSETWPPPGPLPAVIREWYRYAPRATFDDPFVDAARSLLLLDTLQWPAASQAHAYKQSGYVAPTIDLSASFHRLAPECEWLLCVAEAPIAHEGLIGGKASVWTDDGRLLASGGGQLLCRPVPKGSPGAA
jgi:acyl-CoA thioesterase-2